MGADRRHSLQLVGLSQLHRRSTDRGSHLQICHHSTPSDCRNLIFENRLPHSALLWHCSCTSSLRIQAHTSAHAVVAGCPPLYPSIWIHHSFRLVCVLPLSQDWFDICRRPHPLFLQLGRLTTLLGQTPPEGRIGANASCSEKKVRR